jgi:hypothetical protein
MRRVKVNANLKGERQGANQDHDALGGEKNEYKTWTSILLKSQLSSRKSLQWACWDLSLTRQV